MKKIEELKKNMNEAESVYKQKKQENDMKYLTPNAFEKKINVKRKKKQMWHKSLKYDKSSLNDLFMNKRNGR